MGLSVKKLILILLIFSLATSSIKFLETKRETQLGTIHFINTGSSNAFLLESNGEFGLIDSSDPYKYSEHEVEKVVISPGQADHSSVDPQRSVQRVVDYLKVKGLGENKKLKFIVATHAHSDHIGGIPAIAYYFVNGSTYYYYKNYKGTWEDTGTDWANRDYYNAAVNSMKKMGSTLVDVTDKTPSFTLGNFKIELLNTEDKDCYGLGENCYSISQLITIGNNRIFLEADLHHKEDYKFAGKIGIVQVFQLGHHGYSGSGSYELISVIRPEIAIIPNYFYNDEGEAKIAYMQRKFNTKVYITSFAGEDINNAAIRANLFDQGYNVENCGSNIDSTQFNGWKKWNENMAYLQNGNFLYKWQKLNWSQGNDWFYFDDVSGFMLIGWQELEWSGGKNWFYFDKTNGNMYTGWHELDWSGGNDWFYFDKTSGFMVTGWQTLEWSQGVDTFYFDPEHGYMLRNCCRVIDGKNCCFDENGVYQG